MGNIALGDAYSKEPADMDEDCSWREVYFSNRVSTHYSENGTTYVESDVQDDNEQKKVDDFVERTWVAYGTDNSKWSKKASKVCAARVPRLETFEPQKTIDNF